MLLLIYSTLQAKNLSLSLWDIPLFFSMGNCFKKSHDILISSSSSDDTPPPQQFQKSTQGRFSPTPSERANLSSSSSSSLPAEPASLEDELGKILSIPYVDISHSMFLKKNCVDISLGLLIFVQREPRDKNMCASPFQITQHYLDWDTALALFKEIQALG